MSIKMGATYTFYKNGEVVAESKNILTNGFFSRLLGYASGNPQVGHYCACFVGTGTTEPVEADTGMESGVATKSRVVNELDNTGGTDIIQEMYGMMSQSGGKYWGTYNWGHLFSAGTFSGQAISEVGARFSHVNSSNHSSSTTIDSHALIKDDNGAVVPIVLTAADTLYVHVKFTYSMPYNEQSTMMLGGKPYVAHFSCNDVDGTSKAWWSIFRRNTSNEQGAFLMVAENPTLSDSASLNYTSKYTTSQSVPTPYTQTHPHSSDANAGISAVSASVANRTLTITYTFGLSSGEAAGLWQLQMGATSSQNSSNFSINFDQAVTGFSTGLNTITVTYHFGQLSGYGDKPPLTASMHPASTNETVANGAATTIAKPRLVVKGGVSPITYAWTYQSGGSALLSADAASSSMTAFSGTGTSETSAEVWRCTATDADANTAYADCTVSVTWA